MLSVGVYPGTTTIQGYGGPFSKSSFGFGACLYGSFDSFQDSGKNLTNPQSWGGCFTVDSGGSDSVTRTNAIFN
jgi:hypothetical protein